MPWSDRLICGYNRVEITEYVWCYQLNAKTLSTVHLNKQTMDQYPPPFPPPDQPSQPRLQNPLPLLIPPNLELSIDGSLNTEDGPRCTGAIHVILNLSLISHFKLILTRQGVCLPIAAPPQPKRNYLQFKSHNWLKAAEANKLCAAEEFAYLPMPVPPEVRSRVSTGYVGCDRLPKIKFPK
jgi:hypothetical protein